MRLYGIEPHTTVDGADLQTYVCDDCDSVQTALLPRRHGANKKTETAPAESAPARKAFDDVSTSRLGAAYEAAWQKLKATGSPLADKSHAASTRERLAKSILDMGQRGEMDPERLTEHALAVLTRSNGSDAR
jgi:hypothetical protein